MSFCGHEFCLGWPACRLAQTTDQARQGRVVIEALRASDAGAPDVMPPRREGVSTVGYDTAREIAAYVDEQGGSHSSAEAAQGMYHAAVAEVLRKREELPTEVRCRDGVLVEEVDRAEMFARELAEHLARNPQIGLPEDSAARKEYPMVEGLLDYAPDALAEISRGSWVGNQKHNPGEPLHHARGKSMDHANCVVRHLKDRGTFDRIQTKDGRVFYVRHSVWAAWRSIMLLQEELERDGAPMARGARKAGA